MRFYPVTLALSLLMAITASVSLSAPAEVLEPRAASLAGQGRAALASGDNAAATDFFEAALAVQPGSATIMLDLAAAASQRGMPGEALHYYRIVLTDQAQNIDALAGEGVALAQMGALDKARRNLAQVEGLCGHDCAVARAVSDAISKGPDRHLVTADAATPDPAVTKN